MSKPAFLPNLTEALVEAAKHDPVKTADFATAMERVLPVFDHLGSVLAFAKTDLVTKNDSMKSAAATYDNLEVMVNADKKAGTVTKKNSLARNLHRLRTVIIFIQEIMSRLLSNKSMTLSTAVTQAYAESLAEYHSMVVRGTCNAGFLMLPTKESFLTSIGETETSVTPSTEAFLTASAAVIASIDKLFDGPMPASTNWF